MSGFKFTKKKNITKKSITAGLKWDNFKKFTRKIKKRKNSPQSFRQKKFKLFKEEFYSKVIKSYQKR